MHIDTIYYFGYGSLVNRDTRPADEPAWNARLTGWRRSWVHRVEETESRSGCTSLSITRDTAARRGAEEGGIDGVVVAMSMDDLPGLDLREHGYERLPLPRECFRSVEVPEGVDTIHVYRSVTAAPATQQHPILRSYVDCVMAGYLRRFGTEGLQYFLSTTDGWSDAMLDDRAAPRYPRFVSLDAAVLQSFDALLASLRTA